MPKKPQTHLHPRIKHPTSKPAYGLPPNPEHTNFPVGLPPLLLQALQLIQHLAAVDMLASGLWPFGVELGIKRNSCNAAAQAEAQFRFRGLPV